MKNQLALTLILALAPATALANKPGKKTVVTDGRSKVQVGADGTVKLKSKSGKKLTVGNKGKASGMSAGQFQVQGNKKVVQKACTADTEVVVTGNHHKVTLTGHCKLVSVSGNANKVTVEKASNVQVTGNKNSVTAQFAANISVTGNKNAVSYKKGLDSARPAISNAGHKNNVSLIK